MSEAIGEKRATPLAARLAARIHASGPISVRDYMDACLNDSAHGYYRIRPAIGRPGDFVTAPEISQVFGELIGLWAAVAWQQMGAPARLNLVELGPGRGTLMADALRATRRVPGFSAAARVALVEPSPVLAAAQQAQLAAQPNIAWYPDASGIEPAPTVLVANEVLDVVPVAQLVRTNTGWAERGVGLGADERLAFVTLPERPLPPSLPAGPRPPAKPGDIIELRDWQELGCALQRLASGGPLAALFIDYGHAGPLPGDTLQAMRAQRYECPLASPGEADLTAQVDFASFAVEMQGRGLICQGPVTQAEFLGGLGIAERASRLMAANPQQAAAIETAVARLMAPQGMGTRFKVIALRSPGLPPLPVLPDVSPDVDSRPAAQ